MYNTNNLQGESNPNVLNPADYISEDFLQVLEVTFNKVLKLNRNIERYVKKKGNFMKHRQQGKD